MRHGRFGVKSQKMSTLHPFFTPKLLSVAEKAVPLQTLLRPSAGAGNVFTNYFYSFNPKNQTNMIVVPVKEGENIERALKKFKRKFEKTGVVKELRRRQQFDKPSVLKRLAKERAVYVQQLRRVED